MSTDGYPSGRMFRTDIFSIMFRSYYLRGYLFSIKVIPQAVLRFFFFWHGSAWHASGCQKGAADGIWLLGWRLATRAKSAPKFRFRIFPIHRFSSKIDPISYMRRSTVCDSTRFRKIFGNRDFRFQTGVSLERKSTSKLFS